MDQISKPRPSAATAVPLMRDVKVLALVGAGHFFSHFYQITLPPLFILLREEFAVSYAALGLIVTCFMAANGLSQVPVGFLVDRIGARRVLVGGLVLEAGAIGLVGVAPTFPWVLLLALLAGLGHSAFHPANYAILSSSVDEERMGRAFSLHTFSGFLGTAVAPLTVIALAALWGWRAALVAVAGLGLATAAAIAVHARVLKDDASPRSENAETAGGSLRDGLRLLLSGPMLMFFLFFMMTGIIHSGINSFLVVAVVTLYDAPLALASAALTGFLFANAAGILVGGMLADRTTRHNLVAAGAFSVTAGAVAIVGWGLVPVVAVVVLFSVAGLCQGALMPARDMMVRALAPKGASGKAFGFMAAGGSVGGVLTPPLFGWIVDQGQPRWIFWIMAAFALVAIVSVLPPRRRLAG